MRVARLAMCDVMRTRTGSKHAYIVFGCISSEFNDLLGIKALKHLFGSRDYCSDREQRISRLDVVSM